MKTTYPRLFATIVAVLFLSFALFESSCAAFSVNKQGVVAKALPARTVTIGAKTYGIGIIQGTGSSTTEAISLQAKALGWERAPISPIYYVLRAHSDDELKSLGILDLLAIYDNSTDGNGKPDYLVIPYSVGNSKSTVMAGSVSSSSVWKSTSAFLFLIPPPVSQERSGGEVVDIPRVTFIVRGVHYRLGVIKSDGTANTAQIYEHAHALDWLLPPEDVLLPLLYVCSRNENLKSSGVLHPFILFSRAEDGMVYQVAVQGDKPEDGRLTVASDLKWASDSALIFLAPLTKEQEAAEDALDL